MQDQIFTFETLLRRMQLDDGERPFVIWLRKGFVWHTCLSGQNRCSMSLFMLEWGNGNRNQFTNLSFR